ncbi:MAG: TIGR04282 family arsenosugar biosynthesis glycosyltransferase [Pseudomonadales bacterium]
MDKPFDRLIIVFTRAPVQRQVKTRLEPALSLARIVSLHKSLVRHVLVEASLVRCARVELWVDSDAEHPFFQELVQQNPEVSVCLQHGGDLGERMAHALSVANAQTTVLIGSDCPGLSQSHLEQAFELLESTVEVVLGPALDGGYVLVGTCRKLLPIFKDIEWGTDTVFEQTTKQLTAAGIEYQTLAPLADIDRPEDLQIARDFGLL